MNNEIETIAIDFNNMSKSDEELLRKRVVEKILASGLVYTQFHIDSAFNPNIKKKTLLYKLFNFYGTQLLGKVYILGGYIYLENNDKFVYPLFKIMSRKERKIKKLKEGEKNGRNE